MEDGWGQTDTHTPESSLALPLFTLLTLALTLEYKDAQEREFVNVRKALFV